MAVEREASPIILAYIVPNSTALSRIGSMEAISGILVVGVFGGNAEVEITRESCSGWVFFLGERGLHMKIEYWVADRVSIEKNWKP